MTDFELRQFLLAVVVLLGAGHFGGYVFQRLGLPRVIGEIAGGLVVGKSVLGALFPRFFAWLFEGFPGVPMLLAAFYWIGLILLMFTSGFSIEKKIEPSDRRVILTLIAGTTVMPFLAGWGLTASLDLSRYAGPAANPVALSLVVAIAVAVPSIPVISRIFIDLGVAESRFAKIVLSAAVGHDILLWAALAVATGLVGLGQPEIGAIAAIVFKTILFFGLAALIGPWFLYRLTRTRYNIVRKASPIGWVLIICFLLAALAGLLEVNVVFGALLAGIVFGLTGDPEVEDVKTRISEFSSAFFIPFYFAMVGFKIDLIGGFDPLFTLGFILFCTACQLAASVASARIAGCDGPTALNLGVAMNARGGPGIVLATVALEYGIVNDVFYSALIALAIVTSLIAGIWLRYQLAQGRPLYADRHPNGNGMSSP